MAVTTAATAAQRARAYTTCRVGMCLMYVRTWLGIGASAPDAKTAWARAKHKHKGDRTPPKGAPVFYTGGKHGHIAMSLGGGKIRTTDAPGAGRVSTQSLDWPTRQWGYPYAGWSEDLNGVRLGWLRQVAPAAKGTKVAKPYTVAVDVARLNRRAGPGTKYRVRGVSKRGHRFKVARQTKHWVMSRKGNWYARRYVRRVK